MEDVADLRGIGGQLGDDDEGIVERVPKVPVGKRDLRQEPGLFRRDRMRRKGKSADPALADLWQPSRLFDPRYRPQFSASSFCESDDQIHTSDYPLPRTFGYQGSTPRSDQRNPVIRLILEARMVAQREPYEFPAIRAYAAELAAWRGTMSKVELAATLGYTPQLISQLEAGKNIPSRKFAEDSDTLFKTNDLFVRLWKLITDTRHLSVLPPGFPKFLELEGQAATIRSFEHLLVTGLLQTEDYARAIMLCVQHPDVAEEFITTRMERQKIPDRERPPRLWFTIDERGLRWMIGGRDVMCGQLRHLLKMSERPEGMHCR